MEVVCPKCKTTCLNQKFCGNCGHQILYIESEVVDRKERNRKIKQWIIGFVIFLLIWSIGSALLSLLFAYLGQSEKYISAISFVVGIIAMVLIGMEESREETTESES